MADNQTGTNTTSTEWINSNSGGYLTPIDQVRDSRAGKTSLTSTLNQLEEPLMYNTFIVSTNGDDNNDGKSFQTAVASIGRAMTLAQGVTPTTDHKVLFSVEARNFGDLINNTSIGNVANLVVDMPACYFEDVDLTRKTNLITRRVIGNVTLGSGSHIHVIGSLGYSSAAKTVTFVAGTHNGTRFKVTELLDNVTISFAGVSSGSRIRIEVDDYPVSDFDTTMDTLLATIPDGVEVTGYIGRHNFGESTITPTYDVSKAITSTTSPQNSKFMFGASNWNFHNDGNVDAAYFNFIATAEIEAVKVGTNLTGVITLNKHVSGVNWPTNYYYRDNGTTIVPTTDGTDTAPSSLFEYMGTSRYMFVGSSEINELISDTSKSHRLNFPVDNIGQPITYIHQDNNLQLVFNFPGFDVDVASFIGQMDVHINTGDKQSLWNGKTRVRFDKVSTGRYTMTLGDNGSFNSAALKVKDIWNKQTHSINLDSGSHTNQVLVNGEVGFNLPYIPNAQQFVEITFDVDVVEI